jgi:hypothetical protein
LTECCDVRLFDMREIGQPASAGADPASRDCS